MSSLIGTNIILNHSFELFDSSNIPDNSPGTYTDYINNWVIIQYLDREVVTVLDNTSIWQYPRSVDGSYVIATRGSLIYQGLQNTVKNGIYNLSFYACARQSSGNNYVPVKLRIYLNYINLGFKDEIFNKNFEAEAYSNPPGNILDKYEINNIRLKDNNVRLEFFTTDINGNTENDKDIFLDDIQFILQKITYTNEPFYFLKCTDLYYQQNSCDNNSYTKPPKKAIIFNKQEQKLTKREILHWANRNKYR